MDLLAQTKHPCWAVTEAGEEVYLDGTYAIDSSCNRGVYVITPQGLAFLDYDFLQWGEADCGPLCPEHGDPRDTSILEVAR